MDAKTALMNNIAGRRLIALLTIINSDNPERLRAYIADNFADEALAQHPVETRLDRIRDDYGQSGKLRVYQVIASDEHHVVVLMQARVDEDFYLVEMKVSPDYPHKVIGYAQYTLYEE